MATCQDLQGLRGSSPADLTSSANTQHSPEPLQFTRPGGSHSSFVIRLAVAEFTYRLENTMGPPKFPPPGHHPIHVHPARPLYRFVATGLSASMWFFVRVQVFGRFAKLTIAADVPGEERRPRAPGLEASVGPLKPWREAGICGRRDTAGRCKIDAATLYIRVKEDFHMYNQQCQDIKSVAFKYEL
jgi:hypothetical protein